MIIRLSGTLAHESTVLLRGWFCVVPISQRHSSSMPSNFFGDLVFCYPNIGLYTMCQYITLWRQNDWQRCASYYI